MLLVPTYIAPSGIHGCGVFAAVAIPRGAKVWEFNAIIDCEITKAELELLPAPARDLALAHSFINDDGRIILSRDNAVFFNHSNRPNTDSDESGNVANRNISAGEELTEDYRRFPLGACSAFLI